MRPSTSLIPHASSAAFVSAPGRDGPVRIVGSVRAQCGAGAGWQVCKRAKFFPFRFLLLLLRRGDRRQTDRAT
jgi:hypothetical protein